MPVLLNDLTKQTFKDFEVIHVDGESEDKTVKKSAQFVDKLALTIVSTSTRNVAFQRNLGGKKATGEWIIFMDADNQLPTYFLQGIKYRIDRGEVIEREKFDVFTTLMTLNKKDAEDLTNKSVANFFNVCLKTAEKTEAPLAFGAMIGVRQNCFKRAKFKEAIKVAEDNEFVRSCHKLGYKFRVLTNPNYAYSMRRMRANGLLRTATSGILLNARYILNGDMSKGDFGYKMQGGEMYLDEEGMGEELEGESTNEV